MLDKMTELIRSEPFVPFRLILTSGSTYDVYAPLMIAAGKTQMTYYFPKSDKIAHLRINQLAAIETLEPHGV